MQQEERQSEYPDDPYKNALARRGTVRRQIVTVQDKQRTDEADNGE
jgi:hypothetical protein